MQKTCVTYFVPSNSNSMFCYKSFTMDRTYISTKSTLTAY